jgi:hypothetical protein
MSFKTKIAKNRRKKIKLDQSLEENETEHIKVIKDLEFFFENFQKKLNQLNESSIKKCSALCEKLESVYIYRRGNYDYELNAMRDSLIELLINKSKLLLNGVVHTTKKSSFSFYKNIDLKELSLDILLGSLEDKSNPINRLRFISLYNHMIEDQDSKKFGSDLIEKSLGDSISLYKKFFYPVNSKNFLLAFYGSDSHFRLFIVNRKKKDVIKKKYVYELNTCPDHLYVRNKTIVLTFCTTDHVNEMLIKVYDFELDLLGSKIIRIEHKSNGIFITNKYIIIPYYKINNNQGNYIQFYDKHLNELERHHLESMQNFYLVDANDDYITLLKPPEIRLISINGCQKLKKMNYDLGDIFVLFDTRYSLCRFLGSLKLVKTNLLENFLVAIIWNSKFHEIVIFDCETGSLSFRNELRKLFPTLPEYLFNNLDFDYFDDINIWSFYGKSNEIVYFV